MNVRSKTGLEILKVAAMAGILGDVLLRQTPWGLNVFLFNCLFVAGTVMIVLRRKREFLTAQTVALLGAQIFFAAMFVWRDSIQLRIADSAAILAVLSVLFVPQFKVVPRLAGVFHFIVGFIWASLNAIFAPIALLVSDIHWEAGQRSSNVRRFVAILRGLLIAIPVIFIFGALFVAADTAYQNLVNRVFNIDIDFETAISHIIITVGLAWLSAGYLTGLIIGLDARVARPASEAEAKTEGISVVIANEQPADDGGSFPTDISVIDHINRSDPPAEKAEGGESVKQPWQWGNLHGGMLPGAFKLGSIEIGIFLGLVDLLFLSFVLVQLPYLFGGMELVQNTPDFKLAEYARHGFGELVVVSALVLPILLASDWLVDKEDKFAALLYKCLASVQISLLFVIMASAVQRLLLLTGSLGYGLTTVRLYPMIFMIWLAVVFVWFALTMLRGHRQFFAWGALWSAFFVIGAAHILNPDRFIVRTNLALMQQGRDFDAKYNADLSADAVPSLLDGFPALNADQRCVIDIRFRKELNEMRRTDLRSWNISRSYAEKLMEDALSGEQANCPEQDDQKPH